MLTTAQIENLLKPSPPRPSTPQVNMGQVDKVRALVAEILDREHEVSSASLSEVYPRTQEMCGKFLKQFERDGWLEMFDRRKKVWKHQDGRSTTSFLKIYRLKVRK